MSGTGVPNPIRAYVDTSVFGGVFDAEFADHSRAFFERVGRGEFIVLLGSTTEAELEGAPPAVRGVLDEVPHALVERIPRTPEVERLAQAYLDAGVVGPRWRGDATQVALATVAKATVLVSWNFKHMLRFDKINGFNEVNRRLGYDNLSIASPAGVRYAGTQEDI